MRTCEAQAGRGLDHVAHGGDAGPVALDPPLVAQLRPAAVAVHDDGHVAGQAREVDRAQERQLLGAGGDDVQKILQ